MHVEILSFMSFGGRLASGMSMLHLAKSNANSLCLGIGSDMIVRYTHVRVIPPPCFIPILELQAIVLQQTSAPSPETCFIIPGCIP